jgi:phosphonate transport system substrate-binding protein
MHRENGGSLFISNLILVWLCAGLSLIPAFSPVCVATEEKKTYLLAVIPQFPPLEINRDWAPLIERISSETGIDLVLKFYRSFLDFEDAVRAGVPDFVYLSPYHATVAKKAQGYIPQIRNGENKLVGILVVDKESTFKSVQDLNGKTLVCPSNAFAASRYLGTPLHDIVHKYNGETTITSEAVNGTAFTVTIPLTAIATGEEPSWP